LLVGFFLNHFKIVTFIVANIVGIVVAALHQAAWRAGGIFAYTSQTRLLLMIDRREYILRTFLGFKTLFKNQVCIFVPDIMLASIA
jgi:hypothetical protein